MISAAKAEQNPAYAPIRNTEIKMHKTIEDAQKAIKESVDLLHTVVQQFDDISPRIDFPGGGYCIMAPEQHQCANELTRLCLDASKKISVQGVRPCDKLQTVRQNLHDFGFVTEVTHDRNLPEKFGGGATQILLIATDRKIIDIWLKYKLSTGVGDDQEHLYLTGWLLGYPTNSISGFWKTDFSVEVLQLRYHNDLEIYKSEFGKPPTDSVGFNWIYEEPA